MADCDVLIAGAGPTGLVLALWLTRQGVKVRLIDKAAEPGLTSRALAVQVRTLEFYRQADLTDDVKTRGLEVPAMNLWAGGKAVARVPLRELSHDISPEGGPVIFPQDEHEKLLIEHVEAAGVKIERHMELLKFEEDEQGVNASLRSRDSQETCRARYICGCEGAHSVVRHQVGAGFPGGAYQQLFYVADIEGHGSPINGELNIDLDQADFLAVFPMKGEGRARLVGTVRGERAEHPEDLKFEHVSDRAIKNLKLQVNKVHWFSTYRVHYRVTDRFRVGRAFLVGDAAHLHSPAGGQGMNTGIGDAINLAWKLAAVLAGKAEDSLLDSYEHERRAFARTLVATTDRAFTFATAEGPIADVMRLKVAPTVFRAATHFEPVLESMFRTVGQLTVKYRESPLSAGHVGAVRGGDRLPWTGSEADNFAPLAEICWQVHVYGDATADVAAWCADNKISLQVFAWTDQAGRVGLKRDAYYLLRPDTYVALADSTGSPGALHRYFTERNLKP